MSERLLQNKVLIYLKKNNIWHVKIKDANRCGIPDIIGCKDGRFFAIELKDPDSYNRASKLQEYEIKNIISSGGRAIVSRSLQDCIEFILDI